MDINVVCPHCKKTHSNHPLVLAASKGEGLNTESVICDCGERITYWQITAQLRNQKTFGVRFKNWFRGLTHSES